MRKLSGEEKTKSDEMQVIFNGIADLIFVMDKNRILTKVNKATCDAFKKKPEELIGKYCYEIVHGTNCPWPNCPATQTFETKQTATEEVNDPILGRPLLVTTSPILDDQGEVAQVIHIAKDITKMKLAEMEMHISADFFDATSDSILIHDLDGKLIYFNETAYKTRGYTKEEFQALSIQDLETPGNSRFFDSKMRDLVNAGSATFETEDLCKDKTVVPVEIHAKVIEFDGEKLVLTVTRDISERKKIEEEKNNLLHNLGERVKELNCIYGVSRIFEKSDILPEEALPETVKLFSPAMQYPSITCARIVVENKEFSTKNFKETPWKLQAEIKANGKKTGFVEIVYLEEKPTLEEGPFLKEERNLIDLVADRLGKNIERYQAEEALSASERRWATTLGSVGDGVIATDIEGRITFLNREAEKLTGWTLNEASEKPLREVFKIFSEQTRLEAEDPVAKVLKSGLIVGLANNTALLRKDGSEIPIDDSAAPIKDENGNITGVVLVFRDRTERKLTEEKLRGNSDRIGLMNEKLRVVGSLTRHDVRNKLSTVTGYAYLLKKKHADEADIVEGLSKMEQSVKETVKIFEFAKMYEQLGVEELTPIDVEAKLNEATTLFSGSLPKIINECHGLKVLADSFLRQLFYNFIDNTRKYGQKTTTIRVHYEKTDQDNLKLVYEDDGVGIPLENKPRLFKEGFSTGGSTGTGLFLTKKMMDVYGWQIEEVGEVGKGAKFVLTVPKLNQSGKENFQITS